MVYFGISMVRSPCATRAWHDSREVASSPQALSSRSSSFSSAGASAPKSCACTTCHVILRAGFGSLAPAQEKEEDLLDKAWGLEATSRLSCQARVAQGDLTVEIPKYTINYEREGGGKK